MSIDHTTLLGGVDSFAGKVCVVTGGTRGLGAATAQLLSRLGARVAVCVNEKAQLERFQAKLERVEGYNAANWLLLEGDVGSESFLRQLVDTAMERWQRIDGWVNNAVVNPRHSFLAEPNEVYLRNWEINVHAAWWSARMIFPILQETGGSIVSISSVMAWRTSATNLPYTMHKAALEGFTRALAVEGGPLGIRVNAVAPGYVWTLESADDPTMGQLTAEQQAARQKLITETSRSFQPLRRKAEPIDVAAAVAFLLSPAARFISGATLPVDGGFLCELKSASSPEVRKQVLNIEKLAQKAGVTSL